MTNIAWKILQLTNIHPVLVSNMNSSNKLDINWGEFVYKTDHLILQPILEDYLLECRECGQILEFENSMLDYHGYLYYNSNFCGKNCGEDTNFPKEGIKFYEFQGEEPNLGPSRSHNGNLYRLICLPLHYDFCSNLDWIQLDKSEIYKLYCKEAIVEAKILAVLLYFTNGRIRKIENWKRMLIIKKWVKSKLDIHESRLQIFNKHVKLKIKKYIDTPKYDS